MRIAAHELELPLDVGAATKLARQRVDHLGAVPGVEPATLGRLVRAFPSLGAVYAASEADLAAVVGIVAAARIRWFLDAPLDTSLAVTPSELPALTLRNAA